jgi:hypothetical protein
MPGILTVHLAEILTQELDQYGIDVLNDHGQQASHPNKVGEIASWFGSDEDYNFETRLALLDIAVVDRATCKAIALIEIEETTNKPKVLIGDVMAILLGDGIRFQGKRKLCIGPWTTLIVLGHSSSHEKLVNFLRVQANHLKGCLSTKNATIGEVVIGLFSNDIEAKAKLIEHVERARLMFLSSTTPLDITSEVK